MPAGRGRQCFLTCLTKCIFIMKKFFSNVLARALSLFLFGLLLIVFADNITEWIVRVSGIFFIIPGLVALVSYFRREPGSKQIMLYPVLGAGSLLFGVVLVVWAQLFVEIMMYILGGLLIVVAASQFYNLWTIKRAGLRISWGYHLFPALQLAAGLYVVLAENKTSVASLPIILVGGGFIVYSLMDLWAVWLVKKGMENHEVLPQSIED